MLAAVASTETHQASEELSRQVQGMETLVRQFAVRWLSPPLTRPSPGTRGPRCYPPLRRMRSFRLLAESANSRAVASLILPLRMCS